MVAKLKLLEQIQETSSLSLSLSSEIESRANRSNPKDKYVQSKNWKLNQYSRDEPESSICLLDLRASLLCGQRHSMSFLFSSIERAGSSESSYVSILKSLDQGSDRDFDSFISKEEILQLIFPSRPKKRGFRFKWRHDLLWNGLLCYIGIETKIECKTKRMLNEKEKSCGVKRGELSSEWIWNDKLFTLETRWLRGAKMKDRQSDMKHCWLASN